MTVYRELRAELDEIHLHAYTLAASVERCHWGTHPQPIKNCAICAALVRFRAETGTSRVTAT